MKETALLRTLRRLHGSSMTLSGYVGEEWRLPAYYGLRGDMKRVVLEEYDALTADDTVAVADRSFRYTLTLTGRDRQVFLQGMVTNDIAKLTAGSGCRAAMLNSNGQIVADIAVHAFDDFLLLAVDPRAAVKLGETLDKYLIAEKVTIDTAQRSAAIAVGGGRSAAVLAELTGAEVPTVPYGCARAAIDGVDVLVTRNGSRGPASYTIWTPVDSVGSIWEKLTASGAKPVGEIALETVRIESGDPAWGFELNDRQLFPEAEVEEAMSYTKGCYVGQEIIARIHSRGHTNRSLRQVLFDEGDHSMQPGDPLYADGDEPESSPEIGRITSVTTSPHFDGRTLVLAYIRREHNAPGTPLICRYAHREAYGSVVN